MTIATIGVQTSIRIAELGLALAAIAGGLAFLAAMLPGPRRALAAAGGLALAAGAVLVIIATHWGVYGLYGFPHR